MNKNSVIMSATQVVELGKVTVLTLGDGHREMESNWRSRGGGGGGSFKSETTVIELGNASALTLGGMGAQVERNRPNSQYGRPNKK